jgi:ABC-type transport system involved in cytochrome c biogenesis permease subunit
MIAPLLRAACCMLVCAFVAPLAYAEIPTEALPTAAGVPLQDGGRIKPLDTFARFSLLQLSGRTTLQADDLDALPWLLECLLSPDAARQREVFLIENPEVMEALSIAHRKSRERFSYETLVPKRALLLNQARQYGALPVEARTVTQKQTLQLAHNIQFFEALTAFMTPFRADPAAPDAPRLSSVMARPMEAGTAAGMARQLAAAQAANGMALLPPHPESDAPETWQTPAALVNAWLTGTRPSAEQLAAWRALEDIANGAPTALAGHFDALRAASREVMAGSREYTQLPRELFFYRLNPFYWSLVLYVIAFLVAALCWTMPRHRGVHALGIAALLLPCVLHIGGIVLRCIIRGRPPVSTLYESILFVTAAAVVVALLIELMNRRRIAMGIGAALGALGLFLANKYEAIDRTDTMPNLIAVLDTNFWLAAHVTTVTMGYSAGLLAGAIAHVYLIGKAIGARPGDTAFYANLTRMVYGVFCFGLLFAAVGTVLGGIWANESWGRFWGWDPKENGALMIVLWGLAVLHARMGGYVRDYGLHLAAVFGGVIVAFSWFGVNLLGVGLHSYGFTSGIQSALIIFYTIESAVLFIGAFGWLREQGIFRVAR